MGEKLVAFFDKAAAKGGIQAQVKLAMITKMSKSTATSAEDSSENIKKFEEALAKV